jgi:glycosyltransferase involved in cell wall biosynthesis
MKQTSMISFVIPLLNEQDSLQALHAAVAQTMAELQLAYEILFIDDGSTDRSLSVLQELHHADPTHVRVIEFRRNFGKTAALTAGFSRARGEVIVTLDADLRAIRRIARLLTKLDGDTTW